MAVDDASRPPNASLPGSALNASRRPGSAPANALRPGSALNAVRPGSALNASRPGSRASSRSSSRQFDPALFYSSTPTHHNLTSSNSSSNIARARRAENSRHGHVVLFMLGGPACGKTALSSALTAAIPGVEHLQVQQLLRREALAGTELGEHVKTSFALGQALAASVSASVLSDAMGATMRGTMGPVGSARPKHFIVSDFPRTPEHLEAFGFAERAAPGRVAAVRLHEETLVRRLLDYEAHIEPVVRSLAESSWVQAVDANGAWADVLSKVQQALAAVPGYPGPRR